MNLVLIMQEAVPESLGTFSFVPSTVVNMFFKVHEFKKVWILGYFTFFGTRPAK